MIDLETISYEGYLEDAFTRTREVAQINNKREIDALLNAFRCGHISQANDLKSYDRSVHEVLRTLLERRVTIDQLLQAKEVLPQNLYDQYIENGLGQAELEKKVSVYLRRKKLPPIYRKSSGCNGLIEDQLGIPFSIDDIDSEEDLKWARIVNRYLDNEQIIRQPLVLEQRAKERAEREKKQERLENEKRLAQRQARSINNRFISPTIRMFQEKSSAIKTFIGEHKPEFSLPQPDVKELLSTVTRLRETHIPTPFEPLSNIYNEVTKHKVGQVASRVFTKEAAARGVLSLAIGGTLGSAGMDGVYLGVITNLATSTLIEITKHIVNKEKNYGKSARAIGTSTTLGVLGAGLVGPLLSQTIAGEFARGVMESLGNAKEDLLSNFFIQNSTPSIEVITPAPVEEVIPANPIITAGDYSPAIEYSENAQDWIKGVGDHNGDYATMVQSLVGESVGEVGNDLSYIEYGILRGLEAKGLSPSDISLDTIGENRIRLLEVMQDGANKTIDPLLKDAVERNISFEEMRTLATEAYYNWLDTSALDELAKTVIV